jgi:hypothetical protein
MNSEEELWHLEEQFWLGDADFYERRLGAQALMVLPPPAGILDRPCTVQSIGSGARWRVASFQDRHLAFPATDTAILAYTVRADRGGPDTRYTARCSSTYCRSREGWQLVLHQQTLAPTD